MKKLMKYLTLLFVGFSLQVFAVNPELPDGYDYLVRVNKITHAATDGSDKSLYAVTMVAWRSEVDLWSDDINIVIDGSPKLQVGQFVACKKLKKLKATLCSADYLFNDLKDIESFSVLILDSAQAAAGLTPAEMALEKLLPKPSDDHKIYNLSKVILTANDIQTKEISGYKGEFIVVPDSRDSWSSSNDDDGSSESSDEAQSNNDDDGSVESSDEDEKIILCKVKQFAVEIRNEAMSNDHALDFLEVMIKKLRASIDADNERRKRAGEPLDTSCVSARQLAMEAWKDF